MDIKNIFPNRELLNATEAPVDASTLPGTLVIETAGEFVAHSTAGGHAQLLILDRDILKAGGVDDAIASGELGIARQVVTGEMANVRVATGQTITRGAAMVSNGDGQLRLINGAADPAELVLAYAHETITTTADNTLVLVRGA